MMYDAVMIAVAETRASVFSGSRQTHRYSVVAVAIHSYRRRAIIADIRPTNEAHLSASCESRRTARWKAPRPATARKKNIDASSYPVYTIQPVVKPGWQPVWQQVVSCKRGFTTSSRRRAGSACMVVGSSKRAATNYPWSRQGRNHVFKVGGPIAWSLFCTEQNTDDIPSFVHCSLLRNGNHTLHHKRWGGPSKFWRSGPPTTPSCCALGSRAVFTGRQRPWTRKLCTDYPCPRAVLAKSTARQCFLPTRPVDSVVATHYSGQLSLLPSPEREMSTGQSAVTLCSWGVEAGMVHSTCG